jgi:hypothetical protein
MMTFTWKDALATILVAAIVMPFVGYLVRGEMPTIQDAHGMVAAGLVLGLAAVLLVGRPARDPGPLHRAALLTGVGTYGLGVAAAWTGAEWLLVASVIAIVLTRALGILTHTRALPSTRTVGQVREHV